MAIATVLAHLLGPALDAARRNVEAALQQERLSAQRAELTRDIERRGRFGELVGASPSMRKMAAAIAKVAPTDTTVLVHGETGSGKELVAREIHQRSPRAEGPFFAINCAALPETLIESELFGHRRGAFSGADKDRRGIFELAEGGTVFLDEIGELPLLAQAKVLRFLETREVLPLGGERTIKVDVRLVAATHRDLVAEVSKSRFRQDLLFRLNVFPVTIPALRNRLEDVPALVEHFLGKNPEAQKKGLRAAAPEALAALCGYAYPGNVRELAHIIERAAILADEGGTIETTHLPDDVLSAAPSEAGSAAAEVVSEAAMPAEPPKTLRGAVEAFERALIIHELERDGWNRTRTARRLEISLRAFMDKLRRYAIKGPG
jgi:transcriptional regulator with GAF, ATPase, and Fis domain